jgi:hypothetical protein
MCGVGGTTLWGEHKNSAVLGRDMSLLSVGWREYCSLLSGWHCHINYKGCLHRDLATLVRESVFRPYRAWCVGMTLQPSKACSHRTKSLRFVTKARPS